MNLALALPFVIAAGLTWHLSRPNAWPGLLDHPNERSLHSQPVPRSGGIAVFAGVLLGTLILQFWRPLGADWALILSCALPVVAVSLWDDWAGVPPGVRLLVHLLAAALLLLAGLTPNTIALPGGQWTPPPFLAVTGGLLFVIWMINLYNFMDGMDGLAGGMAVIGFACLAMLGLQAADSRFVSANWLIVGAASGFLLFNYPPAKIFLGDIGASLLGFLAAAMTLWGSRDGLFPPWLALLVFSPFIVDATVTLLRRLLRGERVWQAHKTHYYQRLAQSRWGRRTTLLAEYGIMLGCGVSALLATALPAGLQWSLVGLWLVLYGLFMVGVKRLEQQNKTQGPAS